MNSLHSWQCRSGKSGTRRMADISSRGCPPGQPAGRLTPPAMRLTPAAAALAALLLAGAWQQPVQAAGSAGAAWLASGGARAQAHQARPAAGVVPPNAQREQQRANEALSRSIANLNRTANAIAVRQAAQAQARAQAQAGKPGAPVPEGLAQGGLWDRDAQGNMLAWRGAERAREMVADGKVQVDIKQTESRAILNWDTFNVGRNTTVAFDQQADWAVLNRVNDPQARPSQIQGSIKGGGTVMVVNRNGIVFAGGSQVNVRNLVASAVGLSDDQFDKGIFSDPLGSGHMPSFGNDLLLSGGAVSHGAATAGVLVEAGASIATHASGTVTQGGGYVLLLGREVANAGHISTPGGQALLAAGDAFVIRKGLGTDENQASTTRGNQVEARRSASTEAGTVFQVTNNGLIEARTGDITLVGQQVSQEGVLLATSSVHTRGTIHLRSDAALAGEQAGKVTLARDSVTAIVLDESATTALDVQREAQIKDSTSAGDGEYHRRDQSLIQIASAGDVDFLSESLALATGGQILVQATGRSELHEGAQLDVAGHVGVRVAMEANNVEINVQGNEQRDSPGNRDDKSLNNSTIWLDRRDLVLVPAGTNGYETDRWYTAGGLLEVGGYLGISGHGIGEWSAQGGTVRFGGAELITRAGSVVNLSGGTLDVQAGQVYQTFLRGADGRIYQAARAPADMLYTGIYRGYEVEHERWGVTRRYHDLMAPGRRWEEGYTVGRDAGQMVVATTRATLEGDIESKTFQAENQTKAREAALDGYRQAQTARARNGQLIIGSYVPVYDNETRNLLYSPQAVTGKVSIAGASDGSADADIALDAAWLNGLALGELRIYAREEIRVDEAVQVDTGGTIALHATQVQVGADLTARSGTIQLGNVVRKQINGTRWESRAIDESNGAIVAGASASVAEGVTLDVRGVWTNQWLDRQETAGLPYVNGGSIQIVSSGQVTIGQGALLDASSGAVMRVDGGVLDGRGGDIALRADALAQGLQGNGAQAALHLAGELRSLGGKGGGRLVLQSGGAVVIGGSVAGSDGMLHAGEDSLVDLVTQEGFVVEQGAILPLDFHYQRTHAQPGEAIGGQPNVTWSDPASKITLAAEWTLPVPTNSAQSYSVRTTSGRNYQVYAWAPPVTLPAGTVIDNITGSFPEGYVLPQTVFPQGLAIVPVTGVIKAGEAAPQAVHFAAGSRLPAGTILSQDVAVIVPLHVDDSLFRQGFSQYEIGGNQGLAVAANSRIAVEMPVWRVDMTAAREHPGGSEPGSVLQAWLPEAFQQNPKEGRLTQRLGADLLLRAGFGLNSGESLAIGEGASVSVDAGRAVTLQGNGQVTIDGVIRASGGSIDILNFGYPMVGPTPQGHAQSIWIGNGAVLDVAGQAYWAVDRDGLRYGKVMAGGRISIGGKYAADATEAEAVDAFIVVRPGARLDASGSMAVLDLPGAANTPVGSAGGLIFLSSFNGLFLDGDLRAHAGAPGAAGGTLALALESPNYAVSSNPSNAVLAVRELLLAREQGAPVLSETLLPGRPDAGLNYGHGRIGSDKVMAGGFGNLSLLVNGVLLLEPGVNLSLAQSLRLTSGSISLPPDAGAGARVDLSAPYVRLAGATRRQMDHYIMPLPQEGRLPDVLDGTTLVVHASLLDILERQAFGTKGTVRTSSGSVAYERLGFADLELRSQGDIRLLGASVRDRTLLETTGNLLLAARQIYPATHARAEIRAGRLGRFDEWGNYIADYDPHAVLRIERVGTDTPVMPYSVFGSLTLMSANIEQGGVLRAPLGNLILGHDFESSNQPSHLALLPGSLTSISAAGLIMPYGGTVDGLTYTYGGTDVLYRGLGGGSGTFRGLVLRSGDIQVQAGALLDLSGGGELTGSAFLSGRGGSTDARLNPLLQVAVDGSGFVVPGLSTNPVYAIVPGTQQGYAPVGAEKGAGDPMLGQQVTIAAGIPGLPAGTYTLLPSNYALLPGAFRVELNGLAGSQRPFGAQLGMRNGSYATQARLGLADTGVLDVLTTQLILTPADRLRTYSQYNEMSYARFGLDWAARDGAPRPTLERDAGRLTLMPGVGKPGAQSGVQFAPGTVRALAAEGGYGSELIVSASGLALEILGKGAAPTAGFKGVSLHADTLNSIGAATVVIGGDLISEFASLDTRSTQNASMVRFGNAYTAARSIVLRDGALLQAAQVFLVTGRVDSGITVEEGAGINTLGQGTAGWDSMSGYVLAPSAVSVLAVSNGWLEIKAPEAASGDGFGAGSIRLGTCGVPQACGKETQLFAEGTITAATDNAFSLEDTVRYGARNLILAVGAINAGDAATLAKAAAQGVLPPGLTLNQQVLDGLLRGDTSRGAPALENLVLTARDAVNFYGSVVLSTLNSETGKSSLERLVLTTPAIHGAGDAADIARIETAVLTWNGATQAPGAIVTGGAGTGTGRLVVDADVIEFGYGPRSQPDTVSQHDRRTLGFGTVELNARERVTANHIGSLSVYASQGAWDDAAKSYTYHGGDLLIHTPQLTGQAGSVNRITAGGSILAQAFAGQAAAQPDTATLAAALGAELMLDAGGSLRLDTAVLLPSGKLTLAAAGDVLLDEGAQLDLAGRRLVFYDQEKYSWGGDVILNSREGSIRQAVGSAILLDAQYNRAGRLNAVALGAQAGHIELLGAIRGQASGSYDAGGTVLPFASGFADIRAQQIADFAGLNQRLSEGGVFGGRSFQLASGNLVIGGELKAREISVSVDRGSLSVNGTIDASGEQAGSIRLFAGQGVTLAGSAVLDARASVLRKDSYGQVIEAPNRAVIEIGSGSGRLVIGDGARMELAVAGAPQAYGTVTLNAPRLGGATGNDVDIDAGGAVHIGGARTIVVNAFQRYDDAREGTDTTVSGRDYQVIDQAYLDAKHADSLKFMANALANGVLMDRKLAGLRAYQEQFHLRPGVEIVSATPDGDLHVDGDIDMSRYRYASVNPHSQQTPVRGSGEAGALVLRAAGNLEIHGSMTDGFDVARVGVTADDQGWVLPAGQLPFGGDVVIPHGGLVTLAPGTQFLPGRTLNYDLPMPALTLPAGLALPTAMVLDQSLGLAAGSVLGAAVSDASGQVLYAAGTVLAQDVMLPAGTQLGAGFRLSAPTKIQAGIWPGGVPLPVAVKLAQSLTLAKGAVVPSQTVVVLPDGAKLVNLRPQDADGTQGRTWALAPMLAAGSQSWDLRLVAGADLAAADSRLTHAQSGGKLMLADPHFGLVFERLPVPGTGTANVYRWSDEISAELIEIYFGVAGESGAIIPQETVDMLASWGYFADSIEELNSWGLGEVVSLHAKGEEPEYTTQAEPVRQQLFSVLRTGTGDLDLIAAGDFDMSSPFGVYTAGTATASVPAGLDDPYNQARGLMKDGTVLWQKEGVDFESLVDGGSNNLYSAWYPAQGGNVLLRVGGNLMGDLTGQNNKQIDTIVPLGRTRQQIASVDVGSWLWRQGSGSLESGGMDVPTAWWINFGTYVAGPVDLQRDEYNSWLYGNAPFLTGFTGVGTLGGGNLVVESGGDAGMIQIRGDVVLNGEGQRAAALRQAPRSQGVHLAVGSTGRVQADGSLVQTGGGDLDIRIGGTLNPNPQLRGNDHDLNSTFVNLRGALRLEAGNVGGIKLRYGKLDPLDTRGGDPYAAGRVFAGGGPMLVLGDTAARLDTRGDLVLGGVADPGRTRLYSSSPFSYMGTRYSGEGWSWFSLWTPGTSVDLFSAGGNLTPTTAWADGGSYEDIHATVKGRNQSSTMDGANFYPSILRASAASGSIYYGVGTTGLINNFGSTPLRTEFGMTVAPSPVGDQYVNATGRNQLELLARQSIYASGYAVTASAADPASLSSPFRPGFVGVLAFTGGGDWGTQPIRVTTVSPLIADRTEWLQALSGRSNTGTLFTNGTTATTGYAMSGLSPARYYAVEGDIVGLRVGSMVGLGYPAGLLGYRYEGSIPVAVRAGRDLTNAGTRLGEKDTVKDTKGNLISHSFATDISVVEAGRDIRESSFYITGPGLLDIAAGRNLLFADKGEVTSLGDILREGANSRTGGASIAVSAGLGAGAQWADFADRYLDPANQANIELPFADQPGKALVVYSGELTLAQWLQREYGFQGDAAEAEAFLEARQAELDRSYQEQYAAGRQASTRSLLRDYRQESQLYLVNWLSGRFGPDSVVAAGGPAGHVSNGTGQVYDPAAMDAREFFATLAPEQQRVYLRNVYYAELKASGREYNDPGSKRFGSYLRGREAIATLLPAQDSEGRPRVYEGDLTLFSSALYFDDWTQSNGIGKNRPTPGKTYVTRAEWQALGGTGAAGVSFYDVMDAGMHTNFGGDISILAPGGRTLVGVDGGFTPGPGSGVITQGEGDINIFSLGSILMGQSRIFTTFGGNILAWSAQGDINAGRGSKTTVVYTPSRRAYDALGNVSLSPTTPSTGAGIATLNPIPEIPAGDIDLIAPEGIIDAGEAGIRVSGNVNLAAMRVVNAENIQVQGDSTGMPVIASVNIGALTAASSAASSAASTAQDSVQRARNAARQNQPSVVNVQILGFGDGGDGAAAGQEARPAGPQAAARPASHRPDSSVVVLGVGGEGPVQRGHLSASEREELGG